MKEVLLLIIGVMVGGLIIYGVNSWKCDNSWGQSGMEHRFSVNRRRSH